MSILVIVTSAPGSAPHLQRAVRNSEPPCGKLQIAVLLIKHNTQRSVGRGLTDLIQTWAQPERVPDGPLEIPSARVPNYQPSSGKLFGRNLADRDWPRPDMPTADAPDQLSQIYITGSGDKLVPLSTFATLKTTAQPRELKKFQQLNAVRIQGVIPPPVPLDAALGFLETEARQILPPGFTIDYAGESRQLRTEGGNFLFTFLLSAVLIYLVLAAQFESFRDPLIILAGSVPLAVAGALLFSFLGFTTLNIYSQVGLITLVGLVAKNGILIVQFANHLRETGAAKLAAIIEAAGTRLRPILMTTAATVVGHFPLVTATGPGAGARNSIGIMLVSGMIIGTLFTLFVLPSIYMWLAANRVAAVAEAPAREPITGRASPEGAAA